MSWIREPDAEPIPGYRLIEPLGSGGFGEVWKCEAPGGLNKAIKFVYGNLNSADVDGVRAEQEFKALLRIREVRHPFVCTVERIDRVDGELVIVMELAERTLHDLYTECQSSGLIGIPAEDLLRYLRDAAEALDYMYEKHHLQHLDVKPRNLFIIGDRVKVADFGLVKHLEGRSSTGALGGVTPMYAPPETYEGKISPHSDQYSLAIVYQEMLTGHRPFIAKNVRQIAQMHLKADPDLRSLPEPERPIVGRALSKDPNKRFANCMAFFTALYKARSTRTAVDLGNGKHPKSISSTMEEVFLEGYDSSEILQPAAVRVPHVRKARAADEDELEVIEGADLGVTVIQPERGSLRPTLVLGLGAFGRKAMMEIRCRFLDRFGDLSKLPLLRFLYLDTDPDAASAALRGSPEVALSRNEYYPLPLQPVGNYRRRSLDHLSEWLPREKLYAMPRALQTQGSRALGRLAFADNHQRLAARLRRELQEICKPDNLVASVAQTGLALCNEMPRVYVLAAAGGGSSGMLADLGYAVQRQLQALKYPEGQVTAFLLCGAPQDPASTAGELANVYATLTEINHYSDPSVPFVTQYGADGQRVVSPNMPFTAAYLLPLAHRTPDSLDETLSHVGSYLFHEITTPLGLKLEDQRREGSQAPASLGSLAVPARSFGTYGIWFPRGLLLHVAARLSCQRILDAWLSNDDFCLSEEARGRIRRLVEIYRNHCELSPSALASAIDDAAKAAGPADASSPREALTALLGKLEEQMHHPAAAEDPGAWAKQALARVRDMVGSGGEEDHELNDWRRSKLARYFGTCAHRLAGAWEEKITKDVFELMQEPGARIAAAELALEQVYHVIATAQDKFCQSLQQQSQKSQQAWQALEVELQECQKSDSGFRLFGGRSRTRQLRAFMDQLAHFAHLKVQEELCGAARHALFNLASRLSERTRDFHFCRQRLRHLQARLQANAADSEDDTRSATESALLHSPLPSADSFWEMIRESATARVVLPEGESDLDEASARFLHRLHDDNWIALDRELHDQVLSGHGGLQGAFITADLGRNLLAPFVEQASKFLGQFLPATDVAQIVKQEAEAQAAAPELAVERLEKSVQEFFGNAAPLHAAGPGKQTRYLLVPASPAGKALGDMIHRLFPHVSLVRVPGESDLMFLCEQGALSAAELDQVLKPCRLAYAQLALSPSTSPHARFDVQDWLPLDP